MKSSLLVTLLVLSSSILFSSSVSAQLAPDTARIAFVNSDRSAILAKKVGGKVETLFTSAGSVNFRNLAVLASTRDGKSLLIAGYAVFINPIASQKDSAAVFARIDSPFTNTGKVGIFANPMTLGGAKVLKIITNPEDTFTKALPLGVLSPDGNEWYGVWCKAQGGNGQEWFYHGNFNGLGNKDSIKIVGSSAAGGGYHMTNLVVTLDNQTMLAVIMDQIASDIPRAQLVSWTLNPGAGNFGFLITDFTGLIRAQRPGWNIDSSFGFYFHTLPVSQPGVISAELALDPGDPGNLRLYKMRIINSVVNDLALQGSRRIQRSDIPLLNGTDALHLFTGYTGNPGSDVDDKEVVVPKQGFPLGNGGDIMSSFGGDSVVFVTCRSDDYATAAESGIYIYDLNTNTATLVQNDPAKMERQPIFMGSVAKLAPPPGYKVGTAFLDNSQIDFGDQFISGPYTTISITLKDTTSSLVTVVSAAINGTDATAFLLTAPLQSALPYTLHGHFNLVFSVKFIPTANRPYIANLEIHYQDSLKKGEKDSILNVKLVGGGKIGSGGVHSSPPSSFDLSVVPNPFSSSTKITLTAREASSTSLEIRDLLGNDIYSSKIMTLGAAEKFAYTLDANALRLATGVYFIIVRSAGEEITRQVIYVK